MSQITIPSTRRPIVSPNVQRSQRNVSSKTSTVESIDSNKRIRLELETVHNIVGQVKQEFFQRAQINQDLQRKIDANVRSIFRLHINYFIFTIVFLLIRNPNFQIYFVKLAKLALILVHWAHLSRFTSTNTRKIPRNSSVI